MISDIDTRILKNELAKLDGIFPYNTVENHYWNDAYFARSLEAKYALPIDTLRRIVKDENER